MKTDFKKNYQLMPQASMTLDRNLVYKNANEAYCRAVMRPREELMGRYVFDVFPNTEEALQPILEIFHQALAGKATKIELFPYKLRLPSGEMQDRLWDVENQPLYSETGEIVGLVQYCEDVTDREALRKERDIVAAELMHRVRNTMSMVLAVANQTGRVADDYEAFLEGFSGRLMAMSRNFTALSESNWQGLDFESLLHAELAPYIAGEAERVTIAGPKVALTVKATKNASMVLHELLTNASKFGFLTVPEGRLNVSWSQQGDGLEVCWEETGLKNVKPPTKDGYGFTALSMFPNMKVEKVFAEDGIKLSGVIRLPFGANNREFNPVTY